jgi:outer membrane biosynthesis protein TonB
MTKLIFVSLALVMASAAGAQATDTFQRPDCSSFQGKPDGESLCFREAKQAVRYANYAALQKAGLEFVYLARPVDGVELEKAYPEVVKAVVDKAQGEFLIHFSVGTDGSVHDVRVVSASSAPIGALAKLWADTISQWKFDKVARPVTNVPFRRIYLYSNQDDDRSRKSGG